MYDEIPVEVDGDQHLISLVAVPITDKLGEKTGITALAFIRKDKLESDEAVHFELDSAAAERISDLERDLHLSQDNLKHTVTELESVNAELQAANEELMTPNEELQSSNEELQSVNEELYTVNSEYQAKVTELADVNDDMTNFLSTTLVGILMVDNQLNIRKYTEYIADEFNIAEQDVGRSLRYIAYNFSTIDLISLSKTVQKTRKAMEVICVSDDGKSYLVRIAPYHSDKLFADMSKEDVEEKYSEEELRHIEGLVITFVDTTNNIDDEKEVMEMRKTLASSSLKNKELTSNLQKMCEDMQLPLSTLNSLIDLACENGTLSEEGKEQVDKMRVPVEQIKNFIAGLQEVLIKKQD